MCFPRILGYKSFALGLQWCAYMHRDGDDPFVNMFTVHDT